MFNEEHTCAVCIDRVIQVMKKLPVKAKLLVIDDGSSDKTPQIIKQKRNMYKTLLTIITHKKNKGYGAATQTGISFAIKKNYTWILHMDSDLTNDPKYIPAFLQARDKKIDCVKASRYIRGSIIKNVTLYRRVISLFGNYIAHFLFGVGILDCTNGFRMVRVKKLKGLIFSETNFSIILEELYQLKKKRARFTEISYTLTARKHTRSHFSYKPKVFVDYFKYALLSFF